MLASDLTVAIPTYNRGTILVETIARLLALDPAPGAILIVDQTAVHPPNVDELLTHWNADGSIRWIRLPRPSIPGAMNRALQEARSDLVLFLDDDLVPSPSLAGDHVRSYHSDDVWAVVGQCLQPGEIPIHLDDARVIAGIPDLEFRFNHDTPRAVHNAMAGNLSVRRTRALSIGGFDENYNAAAYRFETDFALRIWEAGGKVWFEPSAHVDHLKIPTGGIRSFGDHKATISPAHSVGDYYFAMRHSTSFLAYALRRLRRNVLTRYHARHLWTIPFKVVAELRGMSMARRLRRAGPRLLGEYAGSPQASSDRDT